MSTKTGRAPVRTTAFAVETKVNDGIMTSSPDRRFNKLADISNAAVHDGVINTRWIPNRSSKKRSQRRVNTPPPASWPKLTASATWASSLPAINGRLKGILINASHVYQILAYLKNYEPEVAVAAGILLYPTIDQDFTFTYRLLGHLVRVCSVNLMQPWLLIHHRLLEVISLETTPS